MSIESLIRPSTPKILGSLGPSNSAIAENLLLRTGTRLLNGDDPTAIVPFPNADLTLDILFTRDNVTQPSAGSIVGFRVDLSSAARDLFGIWRPDDVRDYHPFGGHEAYLIRIRFGGFNDDPHTADATIAWHANSRANKALWDSVAMPDFKFPT